MKNALFALLVGIASVQGTTTPALAESEIMPYPNGWIGTETVKTPFGNFDFKNGYPTPEAATRLLLSRERTGWAINSEVGSPTLCTK